MNDMTLTTIPKSDQISADTLIGGPRTIKITKVTLVGGDQPCAINFEGDNGLVWRPGKSMRRVLVNVWGKDANVYVGRSLTIYCDPTVVFGGMAVGGIRISHMSDIKAPVTMALTATRANRKPFTVKPLATTPALDIDALTEDAEAHAAAGVVAYQAFWKSLTKPQREALLPRHEDLKAAAIAADAKPEATDDGAVTEDAE